MIFAPLEEKQRAHLLGRLQSAELYARKLVDTYT